MTNQRGGRLTRARAGMSRILGGFATLPLLGTLAVGSGTAKASVLRLNSFPFLCADVRGGAITDGTPVDTYDCHGAFNQQWEFENGQLLGIGTTGAGSKCLDIRGAGVTPPGTVVELFTCNGGANQQWEIFNGALAGLPNSNLIYNRQDNLCLDGSGGLGRQLTVQPCNGGAGQNWAVH